MKIAITGATGCLGREVLRLLSKTPHTPVALVRNKHSLDISCVEKFKYSFPSATRESLAGEAWDALIHTAAVTPATSSDYSINLQMTANVLELSRKKGVRRFVFISSCAVMGDLYDGLRDESYEPQPNEEYSRSKLACENIVHKFCQANNISYTILRPGLIYGPYDRGPLQKIIKMVKSGLFIGLGDGSNKKSLTSVKWLAEAAIACSIEAYNTNNIYLIVDPTPISMHELVEKIKLRVNPRAKTLWIPHWFCLFYVAIANAMEKVGLPLPVTSHSILKFLSNNTYSSSRYLQHFNLKPTDLFEETLDREVNWLKHLN